MRIKQALLAALRSDQDLWDSLKDSLRGRIGEEDGRLSTVVQAASALEPILAEAVDKRPSRLRSLGLKSAALLAELATEDERSSGRLASIARSGTVGIVFADVAGFTEFTSRHGDAAAIELLGRLDAVVRKAVGLGRGEVVKRFGDGYLLAFPSASQAVRAAVELSDRVVAMHQEPSALMRVAVHAGEPLVESDDLLGHDVNLTARLLDVCDPGEVVVSDAARELSGRRLRAVEFETRRAVKIRGLTLKVTVWSARRSGSDRAP